MQVIDLAQYSELLDRLYEGPFEPYPFHAFLDRLRECLDLVNCTLMLRAPDTTDDGLIITSGQDLAPTNIDAIGAHWAYTYNYYMIDPLNNVPLNKVVLIDEVVPENKLRASEYFKMCMELHDVRYCAAIDMLTDTNQRFSLRLCRRPSQTNFTQEECRFIDLLRSHIRRAVSTSVKLVQLDSERQMYAKAISGRDIGVVMLDKHGHILRSNAVADRWFRERDGLSSLHNEIHVSQRSDLNEKLRRLIAETLEAQQRDEPLPVQALAVPRPSGKTDYQLVIKAIPVDRYMAQKDTPHLTVFISDPEANVGISSRTLITLYKLTPTEAALSIHLAEGKSLEEIAQGLSITVNTARAHLRSVFQKTGVTQQSMLVSLVLKSLAALP